MNEKKISLTTAIVLLIMLLLTLIIAGGAIYIVKDKNGDNNKKVKEETKQNYVENKKQNENNTETSRTDIDKSVSELVTDAKFDYNTGIDSFTYRLEDWETKQIKTYTYKANSTEIEGADLKTSKFPHVNIDSDYARKINAEVENLFDEYFEDFKTEIKLIRDTEVIEDKLERAGARYRGDSTRIENNIVTYYAYKNNDILSVVIVEGPFNNAGKFYTTYNIDLNTGKGISFLEICDTLKFDSAELYELYNNACEQMEKVLKEEFSNQYNSTNVEDNKKKISQNLFSDSTKFFIDNNNKLNVICTILVDVGKGSMEYILPVQ